MLSLGTTELSKPVDPAAVTPAGTVSVEIRLEDD
jgi:hypothetical protein